MELRWVQPAAGEVYKSLDALRDRITERLLERRDNLTASEAVVWPEIYRNYQDDISAVTREMASLYGAYGLPSGVVMKEIDGIIHLELVPPQRAGLTIIPERRER